MPDYSPEELLEIDADRRRRVTAAFRLGSAAAVGAAGPSWLVPLLIGAAIAVAIALVLGIATLIQSGSHAGASPTPAPSATASSR
jgi:hypothetical protein